MAGKYFAEAGDLRPCSARAYFSMALDYLRDALDTASESNDKADQDEIFAIILRLKALFKDKPGQLLVNCGLRRQSVLAAVGCDGIDGRGPMASVDGAMPTQSQLWSPATRTSRMSVTFVVVPK